MENRFTIKLKNFYQGFAPLAHLNSLTEKGNEGNASAMINVDVLGETLTQGPALANLTNGTQAGSVSELINHILDVAVSDDATYGIGATKLFKISSTAVINTGGFPHTITDATDGESVAYLKGNLYYFYNKASGGNIGKYDLASTFDDDWGSTTPTGAGSLQKAIHPSATKEDIMMFGNGRYVGVYFANENTIDLDKLDFGNNTEVADIAFSSNQWLIAVNSGITGTNRNYSQIYSYDGSATSSLLSDEVAIGLQKIGFLFQIGGIVFVAYQDLSFTGGYKLGYITGRKIEPLVHFTGSLPNFAQKTLYKNTILFLSSGLVYSAGSIVGELPFALSQLADGGYATCGALAAPFGTPMIASTDGATNFKLAKFSGYDVTCSWRSVIIPLVEGIQNGFIDHITVRTSTLASGARCDLKLEVDDASTTTDAYQITTTGKRKHSFNINKACDNFRIFLDWSNGSASNACPIKEIQIEGHYKE
jgi:hypothetical protein